MNREDNKALLFLEEKFQTKDVWDIWENLKERKEVQQSDPDEHRWYTFYDMVYEVDGRFFTTFTVSHKSEMQGDEDVVDKKMIIDSIKEVFPQENTITVYL